MSIKNSIGSIKTYTPRFKFIIPEFDIATWHDYIESNFRNIDALFYNLFDVQNFSGEWTQLTKYTKGQVLFIGEDLTEEGEESEYTGRMVTVLLDHTTDNSKYFNIYFTQHPDYYELFADASTAQKFAQQAQQSEVNALSSEQKAKESETNAKNSENVAIQKANEASISASKSTTSANNAKISENSATSSAQMAQNIVTGFDTHVNQKQTEFDNNALSKTNTFNSNANTKTQSFNTNASEKQALVDAGALSAQTSATNAEISETNAKTSENNAKSYSEQAESSATTSTQMASSASNYATTATTQAGIATTQAGIATTKAQEASESAATATSNASIATTKAQEASTSVTNASSSATSASNSASLAESWAVGDISLRPEGSAKYWAEQAFAGQLQSDWNQTDSSQKDYIKNKPTKLSQFTNDTNFVNTTQLATKQDTANLSQTLDNSTTKYPSNKVVQDVINTKQNTIKGAATTITSANLTVNRALISNGDGKVTVSAVTSTELEYLDGVTSAIQTQLNGKQAAGSYANTNLSNVASNIDYIVESGGNDSKWYKKYKSGWIHQGGTAVLSGKTPTAISLLKPMANSSYVICVAGYGTSISDGTGQLIANVTTTSFSFANNAANANAGNSSWLIIGKAK